MNWSIKSSQYREAYQVSQVRPHPYEEPHYHPTIESYGVTTLSGASVGYEEEGEVKTELSAVWLWQKSLRDYKPHILSSEIEII